MLQIKSVGGGKNIKFETRLFIYDQSWFPQPVNMIRGNQYGIFTSSPPPSTPETPPSTVEETPSLPSQSPVSSRKRKHQSPENLTDDFNADSPPAAKCPRIEHSFPQWRSERHSSPCPPTRSPFRNLKAKRIAPIRQRKSGLMPLLRVKRGLTTSPDIPYIPLETLEIPDSRPESPEILIEIPDSSPGEAHQQVSKTGIAVNTPRKAHAAAKSPDFLGSLSSIKSRRVQTQTTNHQSSRPRDRVDRVLDPQSRHSGKSASRESGQVLQARRDITRDTPTGEGLLGFRRPEVLACQRPG